MIVTSSSNLFYCKNEKLINMKMKTELSQLSNLEILSLSGNQLVALPEWTGSLSRLKELYVDNNKLKELPNRLTVAPELSIISVCSNRFTKVFQFYQYFRSIYVINVD